MGKTHGTKGFWLDALRVDGPALRAAATEVAPDTPIPSCPGWTMADLVRHVGDHYRYATAYVLRGQITPLTADESARIEQPSSGDLLSWWDEQYAAVVAALDAVDPDAPAWNWAPQSNKACFWHRRMAHETSIHRWDAQMAAGLAEPIEAKLAADGVAEVLDTWLPGGRRLGPATASGMVALAGTDVEYAWHVRLRGEGVALLDTETIFDDEKPARAVASGPASDLLLALYGRVGFDVLDVTGDETLLPALRVG